MRILILLIFLMSNSFANEALDIKNLIIHKEFKKYDSLTFLNAKKEQLNLEDHLSFVLLPIHLSILVLVQVTIPQVYLKYK